MFGTKDRISEALGYGRGSLDGRTARAIILVLGTAVGLAAPASAQVSYFEDFAGGAANWLPATRSTAPFYNPLAQTCNPVPDRAFLGEFGNQTATLTLAGMPAGLYSLTFDLYILRTWDGRVSAASDLFDVRVNGATILCTSFRNDGPNRQDYPGFLTTCGGTGGNNPAGTGALLVNSLGYRSGAQNLVNDSWYRFGRCNADHQFRFNHPGGTITIQFRGQLSSAISDESWGLDKVCVTTCIADVDDGCGSGMPDGAVTIDDLLYYFAEFENGNICADVDDGSGTGAIDGGVDINDLLYFLTRFMIGC